MYLFRSKSHTSDELNVQLHETPSNPKQNVNETDANGIQLGAWKQPLFGCLDDCKPNGLMSFLCPPVSYAHIASRIGFMNYYVVITLHVILYILGFIFLITNGILTGTIFFTGLFIALLCSIRMRWRLRHLFSIPGTNLEDFATMTFCCCCALSQIANHVDAYTPNTYGFTPKDTLPGYDLDDPNEFEDY